MSAPRRPAPASPADGTVPARRPWIGGPGEREAWWEAGTRSALVLPGAATGGELAIIEELLPARSGPPLHAHPEDETYHVLSGQLVVWALPPEEVPAAPDPWPDALVARGRRCGPGTTVFVSGGHAHAYRVGDADARVLVLSTPAGIEAWTTTFGVPATGPGLPPRSHVPPEVARDEVVAFSRARGIRRLGPPAPAAPGRAGTDPAAAATPGGPDRPAGGTPGVDVTDRACFAVGAGRSEVALGGAASGGRLALLEEWLPHGPGPALHRHPESETFLVLDGTMTFWTASPADLPPEGGPWPRALVDSGTRAGAGTVVHVPGGTPHSWRVESAEARILVAGTPAGLDRNVAEAGRPVPARTSPAAGPRGRGTPVVASSPARADALVATRGGAGAAARPQGGSTVRLGPPPPGR